MPYNGGDVNKKRKVRTLSVGNIEDASFDIDEEDYRVVSELLTTGLGILDDRIETLVRDVVETQNDEEGQRVCKLQMGEEAKISSLHISIRSLTNLTHLGLCHSRMTSLPASIGNLPNLKVLDLSWTIKLEKLPEEIGNLVGLNKLILRGSGITSLTKEVGKLENLEVLHLRDAYHLKIDFPEEIGNCRNLKMLDLYDCGIRSLPRSIGNLKKLMYLDLGRWGLRFCGSARASQDTSPSICATQRGENNPYQYLLVLTQRCPFLGHLGNVGANTSKRRFDNRRSLVFRDFSSEIRSKKEISFALACNRARSRTSFGNTDQMSSETMLKLLPFMMSNATRAFDEYCPSHWIPDWDVPHVHRNECVIEKPDAIYQLLIQRRDYFVQLLSSHNDERDNAMGRGDIEMNQR